MTCRCYRHYPIPDIYLRCQGGPCGHPCDLDVRDHEVCDVDPRAAELHSCGCEATYLATMAMVTGLLEGS